MTVTKTYTAVLDSKPNGPNFQINKTKYVGYVQKRTVARFTIKFIDKLTIYYGLYLRRNSNSVEKMTKVLPAV